MKINSLELPWEMWVIFTYITLRERSQMQLSTCCTVVFTQSWAELGRAARTQDNSYLWRSVTEQGARALAGTETALPILGWDGTSPGIPLVTIH